MGGRHILHRQHLRQPQRSAPTLVGRNNLALRHVAGGIVTLQSKRPTIAELGEQLGGFAHARPARSVDIPSVPRWTADQAGICGRLRPAISVAVEAWEFYRTSSSVHESVCTLVRPLALRVCLQPSAHFLLHPIHLLPLAIAS